ncbi:MAG: methyl-accepting chemotaxis protein, partial [Nitrospirota bacterium]|nr:methyl-accepting chemotaxis protein [Nitrospirota bacterium]
MQYYFSRLSMQWKLLALAGPFIVALSVVFTGMYMGLQEVKVAGPIYSEIVMTKDLVADVLPPPEYLIESYLVALEMLLVQDRTQ